uniref:MICOS complex subunit n=1 Tax=Mola mola TaxID=94237 RepID=A0A3Q3XKL5_MOLML
TVNCVLFLLSRKDTNVQLIKLSLYPAAPQQEPRHVEPEAGQLQELVATLRKSLEPYTEWCQVTFNKVKPNVERVVRFGSDTYAYLRNPPKDFYPRAGVIGFTGILGLFLARGSRIKKIVYPAGLVTVSTSLYYPEQAASIAKSAGDCVYERAVQGYAAVENIVRSVHRHVGKEGLFPAPVRTCTTT